MDTVFDLTEHPGNILINDDKAQSRKENVLFDTKIFSDSHKSSSNFRNPHRLALQSIPAAVRARSAQLGIGTVGLQKDSICARSLSQDLHYMNVPKTFEIHDDARDESEEVTNLRRRLAISLERIDDLEIELRKLRANAIDQQSQLMPTVERDTCSQASEDAEADFRDNTLPLSTTCNDDDNINNCDSRILEHAIGEVSDSSHSHQFPFPQLEVTRRTASPLPSPQDPGVSSSFIRGSGVFEAKRHDSSNCVHDQNLPEGVAQLEYNRVRRQSEPCLAIPEHIRAKVIMPNNQSAIYSHLTFFVCLENCFGKETLMAQPGTSNTPSPILTGPRTDGPSIWTRAPSSPVEDSASRDTDSVADRSEQATYRKMMDRNNSLNWSILVDKIISSNDQQASVALQQKLKVAPSEQKAAMIDAIIVHAFPLMGETICIFLFLGPDQAVNRFGNFLIQRCFEHGSAEQIEMIVDHIKGNVITLSKDAFGCHVIQKAFDNTSEKAKMIMVQELMSDIKQTVTHRYACHVWQKLFEVTWSEKAPEIMSIVNKELAGSWDQIALGETGSLVVQNIFENCIEAERRPCINEVIGNISTIIRGQWGNWVIQHVSPAHVVVCMSLTCIDH